MKVDSKGKLAVDSKDTCPDCGSKDVKPVPVSSRVKGLEVVEAGTWGRACNACYASWGLAKVTGKVPFGSGFYRFLHPSAEVKALMNYKKDTDAKG